MSVTYGFFNSVNGDRTYNADQISEYFLKLISNGVFATPSNAMQVQAAAGMTVNVSAGWGFINCKWINNDAPYSLQLDAADVILNRIDRVVLRLDNSTQVRSITIEIKKGSVGVNPTPPALTRSGDVYELSLAQIYVGAGVTSITQAEITDERPDASVCGWVTGLIDQIDTTDLFAQFTTAFEQWFEGIKDEVQSTTIVMQYHSRYETTQASESTIPININEYNETLDILYVFINGLKLVPGVDYTVDGSNIVLSEALDVIGTPVEFEVLKSVDTAQAESIVTTIIQLFNKVEGLENRVFNLESYMNNVRVRVQLLEGRATALEESLNGLSFLKCTQAEYDAMTTHDENTIYIIIESLEAAETTEDETAEETPEEEEAAAEEAGE